MIEFIGGLHMQKCHLIRRYGWHHFITWFEYTFYAENIYKTILAVKSFSIFFLHILYQLRN